MKIKLAILERDASYLNRLVSVFSTKYADKFEIYSFTDPQVALTTLDSARIDVLIADDSFEIETDQLPKRCGFAYFVDSADIDTLNDQRTIFRYQKAELIYKQILSVYSEKASSVSGLRMDDDSCKEIIFASACGGVGSSSLAAACASHFAAAGKRTLYLNLEKFGTSASFFGAEGQFDMSDVVFAVKSKKANLAIKLESCVRRDRNGVFFYAPAKIALDMMELGKEDIVLLLTELRQMGSYDYIVVDADFSLDKDSLDIYRKAHGLVMVSDGSDIANEKTVRAYTALATLEQNSDSPLTNRTKLIYNRFSSKTGKMIDKVEIQNIGGMPRFAQGTTTEIINQLAGMDVFDKIVQPVEEKA